MHNLTRRRVEWAGASCTYPEHVEDDVTGGPGWIITATDLRPVVTDLEALRAGLTEDPLAEPIELLWTGNAGAALQMLEVLQQTPRVRALAADCHRDLGDTAHAVSQYDVLVAECVGRALGLQTAGCLQSDVGLHAQVVFYAGASAPYRVGQFD